LALRKGEKVRKNLEARRVDRFASECDGNVAKEVEL
jgi:hypothetical protein